MEKARTVIIGCGNFCRATLPGILGHPAFDILAIADPVESNLRETGLLAGLDPKRQFQTAGELFKMVESDFAFIFSNVESHAENCRMALEAGCCVSVAKPFVDEFDDGLRLTELADSLGLWISVGQTLRLNPVARALKQFMRGGGLGSPAFGNIYIYRNRMNDLQPYSIHERWPVINATAIHNFDLLRFLLDADITRVCFRGIDAPWNPYDDPGAVTGWLEFDTGLIVGYFHSFISRVPPETDYIFRHSTLQGDKGALFWNGLLGEGGITFHGEKENVKENVKVVDRDFASQTRDYCQWLWESLYEGREVFADSRDNLRSLAAIKSAEYSAREGGIPVDVTRYNGMV